nr:histidine phosphatase family protein [Alsobacter ponti]
MHLVRHATHGAVSTTLAGRASGVRLSAEGHAQAARLARRFAGASVAAVLASPRERAQETAAPIAAALGLNLVTRPALDEIDIGEWQGRAFADLAGQDLWKRWNAARAWVRPPGGETMAELQARLVAEALALRAAWPDSALVLVSHAEPIRAVLLHALGLSADAWSRIEVAPASVSTVALDDWGARVVALNEAPPP